MIREMESRCTFLGAWTLHEDGTKTRLDTYPTSDQIQELRETAKAHREAAKEPGHERYAAQHLRSAEIFESIQGLLTFYAEREAQAKRSVPK